jgi:hypothetical protein
MPPLADDLPRVAPDLVEEHFDELDFLWEHRARSLAALDWTLSDLDELERRLEAHRDGLRLAGRRATELAKARFHDEATSAAAAATLILCDAGEGALAVEQLALAAPGARGHARRALAFCGASAPFESLSELALSSDPARLDAAWVLARLGRAEAVHARAAREAPHDELALEILGRTGEFTAADLASALDGGDPRARGAALVAAVRCRVAGVVAICRRSFVERSNADALRLVSAVGAPEDVPAIARAAGSDLQAIAALGRHGRSECLEPLVELFDAPALADAALCAYRRITGAPGSLVPSDGGGAAPSAVAHAKAHRSRTRSRFAPGARHQLWVEVGERPLGPGFATATLGVRADLWLGARASAPDAVPLLDLDASAADQMRG